ncbi:unnamed protein product, partial [Heterosigma akashiwo]
APRPSPAARTPPRLSPGATRKRILHKSEISLKGCWQEENEWKEKDGGAVAVLAYFNYILATIKDEYHYC